MVHSAETREQIGGYFPDRIQKDLDAATTSPAGFGARIWYC